MRMLVLLLVAGIAALACGVSAPTPNGILLVTFDTTRADRLGPYGYADARTPTLDRLAREGVLFEQAVASAPITLPSHTSILTGVSPLAHGVRDNGSFELGADAQLVSEALRRHGWRTAAFVGSFVLHPRFGLDQGFEVYGAPSPGPDRPPGFLAERRAAAVVDEFLRWIPTLGDGERFFAWVHFMDPHYPYHAPDAWRLGSVHPYDAEIAYADHELGRLLRGLEERGRAEKLLVVFTADHGEGAGEHGEDGHGVLVHQATLHVPLIFSGAPVAPWAGRRVPGFVSLLDLPVTLLAFAGLEASELPRAAPHPLLLPGQAPVDPDPDRPIYVESLLPYYSFRWRALRGVIEDGYKLVESGGWRLYALDEDPGEEHDIAALEPERVARMAEQLKQLEARDTDLGWVRTRAVDARERELLEELGYAAGAPGGDPFDPALPAPEQRLGDLHIITSAGALLLRAAQKAPLEPGAFAERPDGSRVAGRALVLRARKLLLELRQNNPEDPHVYSELGKVESLLGHPDVALPLLQRAALLQPGDAAVQYHLAHAYATAGRSAEARRAMQEARALDPDDQRYAHWLEREPASPAAPPE